MKFTSQVLSTPYPKKDMYGALRFPTYGNAAFEFETAEDIEAAFKGTKPAHAYSRSSNPSVEYFEKTITNITNSIGCLGFSSGMGALSNCIFAICKAGDEIISSNKLFGTTFSLFNETLPALGITVTFIDFNNLDEINKAITKNTKALFFETITNPQIEIYDIKNISAIAKKHEILCIADTTATPPYMFDSKKQGIDVSILSSTKFISGGGTAVGGIIIDNGTYNWKNNKNLANDAIKYGPFTFLRKLRLEIFRNLGACMSPQTATQYSLGLETMELRIDRACSNALQIAQYLESKTKCKAVKYAGLKNSKYFELATELFLYPGSVVCFELESKKECFDLINAFSLIRRATNLHDNKSLIIHPSSTIYSDYTLEQQALIGVNDTMIRLSVGIENIEDLLFDFEQAFQKI